MTRIGMGFDSHRLVPGRPLMLCGVRIKHDKGLQGHSDADAALHAVTDAVLGALAAGDIGELFPDTDARWRDADSAQFLRCAVELAAARGCRVGNCDVTIVTELPRLGAHKAAMRESLATLLEASVDDVAVKAKTNEKMGWIGRGEGLAVLAAVTLVEKKRPARPRPRKTRGKKPS